MRQRVPQKPIVLAGRTFVPVGESTVEHDVEVLRLLRVAGLEAGAIAAAGEDAGEQLLGALVTSGTLLPLVASLIVPEAHAPRRPGRLVRALERLGLVRHEAARGGWSPEVQAETVAFLKGLEEPGDKQQVYVLAAGLLVPFLSGALPFWRPSPRSSAGQETASPATGGGPASGAGGTSGPGIN